MKSTIFDSLTKKVQARFKQGEKLINSFMQRIELEGQYNQQLELISQNLNPEPGDIEDLISAYKINLNSRVTNHSNYLEQMKNDFLQAQGQLKSLQTQFKLIVLESQRTDKEIKINQDKYEKQREKYELIRKEFEETTLLVQISQWNKEQTQEQRTKQIQKISTMFQNLQEAEATLKMLQLYYNNSLNANQQMIQSNAEKFNDIFSQIFSIVKDITMKGLVNEISAERNIQYDCEQFFQVVQMYTDPATEEDQLNEQIQSTLKESSFSSYLRQISLKIAAGNNLPVRNYLKELDDSDENDLSQLKQYHNLLQILLQKYHGIEGDQNSITQAIEAIQETPNKANIMGFIKLGINQTLEKDTDCFVLEVDQLNINSLEILFELKLFRELGIIILELLKSIKPNLNEISFNRVVQFTMKLIEKGQFDVQLLRRILQIGNDINWDGKHLNEQILQLKIWNEIELWGGIIYLHIEEEVEKSINANIKDKSIVFNNIMNIINKMFEFKLDKAQIKQVLNKYGKLFGLFEMQLQELVKYVEKDGNFEIKENIATFTLPDFSTIQQNQSQLPVKNLINEKKVQVDQDENSTKQVSRSDIFMKIEPKKLDVQQQKQEEQLKKDKQPQTFFFEEQKQQQNDIEPSQSDDLEFWHYSSEQPQIRQSQQPIVVQQSSQQQQPLQQPRFLSQAQPSQTQPSQSSNIGPLQVNRKNPPKGAFLKKLT